MQNSYIHKTVLEIEHVDLNRDWTLSSILMTMQTAADIHANQLGAGRDHVLAQSAYWIIARLRVEMRRYPHYLDEVFVTTWPGAPDRLGFPRYFRFAGADGETIGAATSIYMLLHSKTHDIVPPASIDVYGGIDVLPDKGPAVGRIKPGGEPVKTVHRAPVYSDIDLNRHMNNTRYAQWACDLFPTARFEAGHIDTFQLNYVSDGIEGHDIELRLFETGPAFTVAGTDTQTGKTVFQSAGSWHTK